MSVIYYNGKNVKDPVRGETTSGCGVWRRDSASEVGALNATRKKKKTGEETGRGKEAALRGRITFGAKATVIKDEFPWATFMGGI